MTSATEDDNRTPEWKSCSLAVCAGEAFQLFCEVSRAALSRARTRRVPLIGKQCRPEIFNTFLGYEIIGAGRRILCPDMPTARYLRIFAEIGLKTVDIPYDVTQTRQLLPDLERAYASLRRIIDFYSDQLMSRTDQAKFRRSVYATLQRNLRGMQSENPPFGCSAPETPERA